jgi:hypothetical protein
MGRNKVKTTNIDFSTCQLMVHNGGDWRSKSLALPLIFSNTLDGFYFANCVLSAALFSELTIKNK